MPQRHTVYSKRSAAALTPETLLKRLKVLDFWTLGEDYGISSGAVEAALPLQISNVRPGPFHRYHMSYGKSDARPIEIERWETEGQHRAAVVETIDNLTIEDQARARRVSDFLGKTIESVSVAFGVDPPAAMFAWEVVRYIASEFDGIVHADDGEWLKIGGDYQPRPV